MYNVLDIFPQLTIFYVHLKDQILQYFWNYEEIIGLDETVYYYRLLRNFSVSIFLYIKLTIYNLFITLQSANQVKFVIEKWVGTC